MEQGFKIKPLKLRSPKAGFTLIEIIIYLGIFSIILVSISFLILDVLGGQTKNYAYQETSRNSRFLSQYLIKDISGAKTIISLSEQTLVLNDGSQNIIYNFDPVDKKITRQVATDPAVTLNSSQTIVTGSFADLSYLNRVTNVGVNLVIVYKNPSNLADRRATSTASLSVNLKNRR